MTAEGRLGQLFTELTGPLGLSCLVMGGHAVRYYGVDRSTLDYDLHVALDEEKFRRLGETLRGAALLAEAREGPSWRPEVFRRFVIGALKDGREERLEFWRANHLLAPFDELFSRREEGPYGGANVCFLGLSDLIRSKETEREDDWRDVLLLEEIADERALGRGAQSEALRMEALGGLRSRRGFERAVNDGLLADSARVTASVARATNEISLSLLAPAAGQVARGALTKRGVPNAIGAALVAARLGSPRHLALVEAVRRLYQRNAMAADRADKMEGRG